MKFDELVSVSLAPKNFSKFIDCYTQAQSADGVGVQSALPMRSFAPLMANITLLEIEDGDHITYRIAGENIVNRLGFNPTGKNFLDMLSDDLREQPATICKTLIDHPCGHYLVYENEYERGHRMQSESLTLPLHKDVSSPCNLLLSYHVHHQGIGALLQMKRTSLIVSHEMNQFVDIGAGAPRSATHADETFSVQYSEDA